MFEFCGEITGACKDEALKEEQLAGFLASVLVAIPFTIITVLLTFRVNWAFSFFIVFVILFVALASKRPSPKSYTLILPSKVIIEDGLISAENSKFHICRKIDDIKWIIDRGDWYQIKFYFPHNNSRFRCQKNLLSKGSIDDFERMFEGKVVRVNRK